MGRVGEKDEHTDERPDDEPPSEERQPEESLQDYVDRRLREERLEREADEL
ncbi:MAG: hypothetical protein QOE36_1434 [Gaiellaceae bacterium]|jgi:hypothetical protein|nr:hypothetical protein [Gaiellaceae bacterium]